ncbi:MAG TPA: LamG-like jellyroll fold domain-containing protein [Trebonia sp.]|nr:LamG-like jellyroll fold domain-containing protein [Trebonia sp.]
MATSWVFPLKLTGLTASLDGGSVDLKDSAGKVVWVISPAVARSGPAAAGSGRAKPAAQASSVLAYHLVTDDGAAALQMTLSRSWLDAKGRVFPVVVDPTIYPGAEGSTYVESDNGSPESPQDNGESDFLESGAVTFGSDTYQAISFLDFSGEPEEQIPGAHVTSASLYLFDQWAVQCSSPVTVNAYQVTQSWSPSDSLTYPGPAYGTQDGTWTGTAPSDACVNDGTSPGLGGWIGLNFNSAGVALLNDWTTGTGPADDGFAVASSQTDDTQGVQFDSANETDVPSSDGGDCSGSCNPFLEVNYTPAPPPQINSQYPPDNYNAGTLTPELMATGSSPEPGQGALQYDFSVYTTGGTQVADSGLISSGDWTVPAGDLSWGQTYYWTVQDYNGTSYSSTATTSYFSTTVPQSPGTSEMSVDASGSNTSGSDTSGSDTSGSVTAASDTSGSDSGPNPSPGFDAETGNYTTTATDAQVPTVGPALEITRDYNSQDPSLSGAFGAGWSSVLDMEVASGQASSSGSTATETVTYPDGEQVSFGETSTGTYTSPSGRYATLATAQGGGFTLTDKNDTVYTFGQSLGGGAYGITSIADAFGHTETFTWTSSAPYEITQITSASGRTLSITWTPAGGSAKYPHVSQVTTNPVTSDEPSTDLTWTYGYTGDALTSVCSPQSTSHCTEYSYTSGSDYPESVLNTGPQSYWRLDETSGTTAASSVLQNEGADNATYSGVTLGIDSGPLAGSSATAASFNGSSSHVTLPVNLVSGASYQSVSLWFKTTSTNGVLFSYQSSPLSAGTTTGSYTPSLYVGSDGKLVGEFWNGSSESPMESPSAVNDGKWHLVTLTASGSTQTMYLDGVQVATLSGTVDVPAQANDYVGAGFLGGGWPDEADYEENGNSGYANYFDGDISDVAFWNQPVTAAEVSAMYAAGTQAADLMTKITRPSGNLYAAVSYDPLTGRTTSVTDENGGTWTLHTPTVSGSSEVYAESVLGAKPLDYWRLADSGTTDAVNQVNGGTAGYSSVTQGVTGGPFSDSTVDSFNGSSSYLQLPQGLDGAGSQSVSLWFKTSTAGEVLLSSSVDPLSAGSTGNAFTPMLYVGSDGYLVGTFWAGTTSTVLESAAPVNDGQWHNVILTAGDGTQDMYIDGALADSITGTVTGGETSGQDNLYAGAGFLGGGWPDEPGSSSSETGDASFFQGDMSDLAFYGSQLTADQVTAQWDASRSSGGLTPVETATVTDPGGNLLTWKYDLLNGGRIVSQTDARGETTTYGYDIDGFQDEVVDPDGDYTQTGYDVRGNVVSQTTCQDQATDECSTSYYSYYPNDTSATLTPDPRNDVMLTSRDGRSSSSTDPTYETAYTYSSLGELTAETTPPVAGHPSGRTTSYLYTDGSTTSGGYNGAVPPKGLQYQETTPGGAVTTTLYYADGDVAETIDPDGLATVYTYDGVGRELSETAYSDSYPDGLATTFAYNANGQVVTETDPSVPNRVTGAVHTTQTTTTYDADGNMLSQTVSDTTGGDASRTVTRTYNSYDELASETDADGATTSYTYNSYGDVATETDPDGNVTAYTYDGDGNLLTTTLENYTGSPSGSQSPAPLHEESRSYDPAGLLASVTDAMGRTTDYAYTNNGLLASVTDVSPDGTQSFTEESDTYDAAGNLIQKVTNNGATTTDYTVDAADRVTQEVLDPNGLDRTTSISYTPDDEEASVTQSGPSGATQTTSYTYDPMGNMTSQTLTDPGAAGPAAWFNLSQTSGTHVPDGISGGQSATASGVTWDGSEATFSGTEGQGIATNGPVVDTTGSYTVSAWVNLAGDTSDQQIMVSQSAGTNAGFYLKYDSDSGDWEFSQPNTDTTVAGGETVESSSPAATGTWTLLTGTYDVNTSALTLYVNGSAVGTATGSTPIASDGPLLIGAGKYDGTDGSWFDGQIADVQVYPRALSASEVSSLYGLPSGYLTSGKLTTSWTLDQRGLPTSMTDSDGNVTDYSYDQAGQLTQTTEPPVTTQTYGNALVTARPVLTTGYDTFGDTTQTKDSNGNVTTYGYDADGQQVSEAMPSYTPPGSSSPITATETETYDGDGQVMSQTDALGNKTTYAYDQLGDETSETAPNGSVTSYTYDDDGEQLSATGPTGAEVEQTYDYLGRELTSTQIERYTASGTAPYTTNFGYGSNGWLRTSVTPDGSTTTRDYDAAGELTSVTDAAGDTTNYDYDFLGRQTAVVNPDGTSTVTGYDAAGNVTSTSNLSTSGSTLTTTSATYDGDGDKLSSTDADGNSSTFTYDPTGMVTSETQPVSDTSAIVTSFGYDADGNETRYTDGDGNNWYYTYNSWNLPEFRIEPATSQYSSPADSKSAISYDADGNPVTETEPGGVTLDDSYNNVGELTSESGSGAGAPTATRTFGYDAAGDMTSAATSNAATSSAPSNATSESFTYNDRGQVLTANGTAGSTSYTYNGDGLVTSVADAAGDTQYTYDSADRLSTLTDPATGTTATYTYNSDSLVSKVNYGSDARDLTYNSLHELTNDSLQTSSGTTVASVSYGYDPDGEITSMDTTGLAGASSNTYAYDEAGRLTSWDDGTTTTDYGYDADGNLTQDGSKTYTYDARDELTSDGTNTFAYTANGTQASATSAAGTVSSTYDAYGDQITDGTQSYSYDAQGRMVSDSGGSGQTGYNFSYVGSTGTIASDGVNTYTWDPSGTSLVGIGVSGDQTAGVLAYTDTHDDVIGQFTASGSSMSSSTAYDPWGDVTATHGTPQGQIGYQSGWTDPATEKVAMGARWYDPSDGDFSSADTTQVSPNPDSAMANPYAYVGDDPVGATDPTGHCGGWFSAVCSAVDAVTHPVATVKKVLSTAKKVAAKVVSVTKKVATAAVRKTVSAAVTVADAAASGVRAVHTVVQKTISDVKQTAAAVTTYTTKQVKRAVTAVTTAYHTVASDVDKARAAVVKVTRSVGNDVKSAASDVANHVASGAKAVGSFVESHASTIGGALTGVAVFAGCEFATGGAGSIGCAALSGAAANAVSYAISAAQSDSFSFAGLGEAALMGGVEGLAGGEFGEALAGLGGLGSSLLGGALDEATDVAVDEGTDVAADEGVSGATDDTSGGGDSGGGDSGGGDDNPGPSCGGQSFTAGTLVLLASGKAVPISSLKVGEKVKAVDTKVGKTQEEKIAAVLVHYDTDLYDLKVESGGHTEVIDTTSSHLFWDPATDKWVQAAKLRKGEHLKTANGTTAVSDGGTIPNVHDGWMWDLTVPGNDDHDFYVQSGSTGVLVHNCGGTVLTALGKAAKSVYPGGRNLAIGAVGGAVGNLYDGAVTGDSGWKLVGVTALGAATGAAGNLTVRGGIIGSMILGSAAGAANSAGGQWISSGTISGDWVGINGLIGGAESGLGTAAGNYFAPEGMSEEGRAESGSAAAAGLGITQGIACGGADVAKWSNC